MIKRLLILIIVSLFVFGAGFYMWHSAKSPHPLRQQKKDSAAAKDGIEQKVLSFTMDGRSAKGAKQWHLDGKSAELIDDEIHLKDLSAVAYGDESAVNLTSSKGIYRRDKEEVELIGDVEAVSDDGSVLTTDKAIWSQATKDIYTDSVVHIKRKELIAVGKGGSANSERRTASLEKDVVVTMEPNTKISCDGSLEVDYDANMAVFNDNVKVVDKDGELLSDKLTVLFDPEKHTFTKVIAEGNVKTKRGESYTISEKAIYTESTRSARLIGSPRVIIDPQQMAEIENSGEGGPLGGRI